MSAGPGQPTLADISAYYGTQTTQQLVEQYLRSSFLLQQLPFENSVQPNVGAGLLTYSYTRNATMRGAQFRDWYVDYPPEFATVEMVTTALRPMGGAHELDRVFAQADRQANYGNLASWVDFQTSELARAVAQKFHDTAINGDPNADPLSFEGLSSILDGTPSEVGGSLDLSSGGAGTNNSGYYESLAVVQRYINRVRSMGLTPQIWTNEDGAARLSTIGSILNYRSEGVGAFGETITRFAQAPLVDLGVRPGTEGDPVIPTVGGVTDIYIVGLGINGFHGVTLTGDNGLRFYTNVFETDPGVTRRVEAELVSTVALKQARAAWVLRDVRVAPAA